MLLTRNLVEKPWGRDTLPEGFARGGGDRRIGEVWYDRPGDPLPILVKWLFTSEKLSVQVHPSDAEAAARGQPSGKEECWFIVDAEPGAVLGMGTTEPLDDDRLRAAAQDGSIEALMDWKPVRAGDFFYIPAGTVHAIGAGITLVEVQQNADITYRLYDYGRPRELHLDDGVAVSDARPYADARSGCAVPGDLLFDGPYFAMMLAAESARPPEGRRSWWVPVEGSVACGDERAEVGDCLLAAPGAEIRLSPGGRALLAWESAPI